MSLTNILFFIISAIGLVVSATFLVKSLSKIARFLRVPQFTAAFILMPFATSLPEFLVGISAATSKVPELSLGNVIGASIIDLTLIMGILIVLARGVRIKDSVAGKEIYLILGSVALLIILFLIGKSLSRIDGFILVSLYLTNLYFTFKKRKKYKAKFKEERIKRWQIILNSFVFIFTIAILFLSATFTVKYASLLAVDFNLPKIIAGLFLLSFATTLPELIFGIEAIKLHHKGMAIGDLIGGVFANIALVVGIVSIITPIKAVFMPFIISSIFLFISVFFFLTFLKSGKKLEIREGIALILFYVFFMIIEFFTKP